ncbi:zinc finger protein 346 [Anabrus simplex]|uniref:zinc finger protein 346 n=1 Tax=Anabrus simplex TaxID=316456 RepID=UPI0035A3A4AB
MAARFSRKHLSDLLPPPPPPLTLPPPPPPPPPILSSSNDNKRLLTPPCKSDPEPASLRLVPQGSFQPPNSAHANEPGSQTFSSPSGGYKRPIDSPSLSHIKKLKTEDESSSRKTSIQGESLKTKSNKPSGSPDGANNSRRADLMQQVKDPGLPKELIKMFGPLKCDLCSVSVNSTVQAKMHYIGKQHEKKVNAYLTNWCKETGQPMPTLKFSHSASKKAANPEDLFCKVCNLALTSVQHAQQHYMGRNHLRVLNGHRPLKPGYFNKETGKWQRVPNVEKDPTGRFGIGSAFIMPQSTDPLGLLEMDPSTSNPVEESSKSQSKNRRFFCDLCQVATTSQDQLDMHFKGAKHRKAEKLAANAKSSQGTVPVTVTPSDSILASVIRVNKPSIKDYSIYRTPSGQFYCQPCNLTLNSESQFSQHCESKKHKLALLKKPAGKGAVKVTK